MAEDRIRVDGLKEFRRELKALDAQWPKELRTANKEAADIVAEGTRSSFLSRPGVAPKVAASVKALAQQTGAAVQIGGDRWPFALGSEFGGGKFGAGRPSPRGGHTTQFPAWRGSGPGAGYSLYPTFRAKREEVIETYGRAIDRLTARAFPD